MVTGSACSPATLAPAAANKVAEPIQDARLHVAYIMSRFPKLTETFVLDEILELERKGVRVEVFPLWRERTEVIHPEAVAVVDRAHFTPTLNLEILRDNLRCFARAPLRYLDCLATLVRANCRSARFLLAALAIFPKSCHFAERMRALEIDHVHAHFASHPAAAAFVIGRLAEIPWSFTAHGSDLHRNQSMLREKVREARRVIAISEYNKKFILMHAGPEFQDKVRVVHCGVDARSYVEAREQADLRTDQARLEIVCVGTLHEVKGQRFLLEACAVLSSRGIDWRCHLIGDGSDRASLVRLADTLGISARVVFHGRCQRDRVRELLGQADVAVAPSVTSRDGRREGIPVALMEAAACALPLVASRLSGIPELVIDEQTGILVEPGDAEAIAVVLERLAREETTRRRLGQAALEMLERDFSLEQSVETLCTEVFAAPPS